MGEYRYKIRGYGKEPIYRVEMVSETAVFVTIKEPNWRGELYELRQKKEGTVFATFEEARDWLIAKYEGEAADYRKRMNDGRSRAGEVRKWKNPYAAAATTTKEA